MTRSKLINLKVTVGERRLFHSVARRQRTTLSNLIRELLKAEAERCGVRPPDNREGESGND